MNIGFKLAATSAVVLVLLFAVAWVESGLGKFPEPVRFCLGLALVFSALSFVAGLIAGIWLL